MLSGIQSFRGCLHLFCEIREIIWKPLVPARNAVEVNSWGASSCGKFMQMQVDQVSKFVVLDIGSRGGLHRCWHNFAFPIEFYFFEPEPEGFEALSKLALPREPPGTSTMS